jgi:hypothetical protein
VVKIRHYAKPRTVGGHNWKEMRIIEILILTLGTVSVSLGQVDSITRADLDTLYVTTIRNQLGLVLSSGHKYFEITENTERIKDKVGVDIFKFMTDEQLIDKSIREKKPLTVYFVTHRIISNDTVDINIGDKTLTAKRSIHFDHGLRTRKANFAVSCGGTNGYVPTARFAYNLTTNTWDKIEFIKPKNFRDRANN